MLRTVSECVFAVGGIWFLLQPDVHPMSAGMLETMRGGGTDWCITSSNCAKGCARVGMSDYCDGCENGSAYAHCAQLGTGTTCTETYDNQNPVYCGGYVTGLWDPQMGCRYQIQGVYHYGCHAGSPAPGCVLKPNSVSGQSCGGGGGGGGGS